MKVVEILGKVPTALSNDENTLFRHIDKKGKVSTQDLSDFWSRIAEQLCQKGLVYGTEKGADTFYRIANE
jgi:hypothetical protein